MITFSNVFLIKFYLLHYDKLDYWYDVRMEAKKDFALLQLGCWGIWHHWLKRMGWGESSLTQLILNYCSYSSQGLCPVTIDHGGNWEFNVLCFHFLISIMGRYLERELWLIWMLTSLFRVRISAHLLGLSHHVAIIHKIWTQCFRQLHLEGKSPANDFQFDEGDC